MVKRRLNKKVALIGSTVVVFFLLVAIWVAMRFGRGPEEYLREAEAAMKAAHEATDEKTKEENYERAVRNFQGAYGKARTDSFREEVLFRMVDLYLETDDWRFVLGCWNEIVKVNPNNANARYGRLTYYYIMAKSGSSQFWQEVRDQASEFLEVAEEQGLLAEDTAKWDVFDPEQDEAVRQPLGPHLHIVRGRAALQMASLGIVTDRDGSLAQAVEDFKKVQEYDPNSIDAYKHLAQAAVTKGEIFASRGDFEERDITTKEALALLGRAVEVAENDPMAHINLLELKLLLARRSGYAQLQQQVRSLEPEYVSLMDKFSSSAEALAAVSDFYAIYSIYSGPQLGAQNLDKSIQALEKALALDPENVAYAMNAANLHYRRCAIYGQKEDMGKSVEIAVKALTLPGAQDTPGPRRRINMHNRHYLYAHLANCYIEQILEARQSNTAPDEAWLAGAEQAVHEIEQIWGSGEEPQVVKWRGMLDLARGNTQAAIRRLHAAYEQLKALKPNDAARWPTDPPFAQLCYTLAKLFENTSEIGAVNEFLISAILSGVDATKPEARLDYVDVRLKFHLWADAEQNLDSFEDYSGPTPRSQNLRIRVYIGSGEFDKAERELARRPQSDPNVIRLHLELTEARIRQVRLAITQKKTQSSIATILQGTQPGQEESDDSQENVEQVMTTELKGYNELRAELLDKLLPIEPNAVKQASVIRVCRSYMAQDQMSRAKHFVDLFLQHFPENAAVLVYKQILAEPNPRDVSRERLEEIEEQVLLSISDPIRRAVQLGIVYRRYDEIDKAIAQLKKGVELGTSQAHAPGSTALEQMKLGASYLFDIAVARNDWPLAEQVSETARDNNLDDCEGQVFLTRLAVAKGEYEDALARINECLKQRPVFSHAYMLRSNINFALGNDHASLEDISRAASLNPLDGSIAKGSASALYRRNQKLGDNVSTAQIAEAKDALERAVALNPNDMELLSSYTEYISPTDPLKAVAIRQNLYKIEPSLENALLLGRLAMEVAAEQADEGRKQALLAVAGSAFEQARQMNPSDRRMLYHYGEYLRTTGQGEKAKELLRESQDQKLLWDHYFQAGQYDDARKVLEQLYESGAIDSGVLRGLLRVAEKTSDREAASKYSEELIALEDTADNNLAQVQAFLRVGLVKEAEYKLQSLRERYPDEPRMLLLQAWLAMRQGQLEKAVELTNKTLQNNKDNSTAWRLRGEINFFRADYDKAISDLRQSKLLSDGPVTRLSLAKAYVAMERYEDAITELKNTIDAPGAPLEARSLLESIFFRLERKQALKEFYDQTLRNFPDSARWLNRAGAFAIRTEEFDRAEQLYKKAFQVRRKLYLNGENSKEEIQDVLYATAFDGYLKALLAGAGAPNTRNWDPGKLNRVIEECKQYQDSVFAPIAYLRMAQAKLTLGDRSAAIEYCREAVDKAGTNETLASEVLLRMYLILGADEVSKYCSQKLVTNPDSLAANFTMFNLAKINGEFVKAIEYIEKCINLTRPAAPGESIIR